MIIVTLGYHNYYYCCYYLFIDCFCFVHPYKFPFAHFRDGSPSIMSSKEKVMESGEGGVSSHDTPHAITIHIMAPSNLETSSIDSALVASVEAQDARQEDESSSLLVVPADGEDAISVSAKNILQTVTETHIGSEDLTVISNISSDQGNEQTIELGIKSDRKVVTEELEEDIGCHCLICNEELKDETVSVFRSFTTTSHRKISIFLGIVVGQKLTSRKVSLVYYSQIHRALQQIPAHSNLELCL